MERHTLDAVDVHLPGGRVLRAGLYRAPDGTPRELVLSLAFGHGERWGGAGETLALPADVLPQLRAALAALANDGDGVPART